MNRCLARLLAGGFLVAAACVKQVDPTVEQQRLLEIDRAWAAAAQTGNVDSIVAYWTDDARVSPSGEATTQGKPALRAMVTGMLALPGFRITWTPQHAEVSASGDLGYTTGTNDVTAPDASGHLTHTVGRYLEVWRKGPDGRWRCVEDFSNPGPPAPPAK